MVRRDMPIEEFAKTLTIIVGGEIVKSKQVNDITAMCITKDCDSSLRPMVHVKPLYDDYINDKITMADAASYILRIFEAQAPIYDTLIEWDEYEDYLTEIINDVNKTELDRKDWLSDKLYSFK